MVSLMEGNWRRERTVLRCQMQVSCQGRPECVTALPPLSPVLRGEGPGVRGNEGLRTSGCLPLTPQPLSPGVPGERGVSSLFAITCAVIAKLCSAVVLTNPARRENGIAVSCARAIGCPSDSTSSASRVSCRHGCQHDANTSAITLAVQRRFLNWAQSQGRRTACARGCCRAQGR